MLGKRKAVQAIPPPRKKRKSASAIEEISFDFKAREEYLTGFHKRKLQRIKHAKEEAAKKDRADKIVARKILREERKADLEKHVAAVNSMIRQANVASDLSEQEYAGEEEPWDGIKQSQDPLVDHEDEYVDEDRFTAVTVEAVDVSKDGLQKTNHDEENEGEASDAERPGGDSQDTTVLQGIEGSEKGKRSWAKEAPNGPKKQKKKKKFRYESKAERKATRHKERLGNKAQAMARKAR